MRWDRYRFSWGNEGHVTVELLASGKVINQFTIDDVDCDNFISDLVKSRKQAKRAKRN
ncbi:hypothetical protein SEA_STARPLATINUM_254 [Streptomyces phage StarPlatinum]|uniref:Uncharacterized protein n=1 Tax=Streptomyces phage StarPlatinum TaxID=2283265 RepID=A0A345M8Y6_9CAUD|nr:hypothetical protein HWB77_gp079 [Streptomyces phage StarPlatinum]AXH66957.1 hypothetical protein SEA_STARPLATINUM_254 [Streptomyces phage StarPlatinum]